MHPAMIRWARERHHRRHDHHAHGPHGDHPFAHCGGGDGPHHRHGGRFGRRRPLRYLSHKLGLDDKQVAKLAKLIDAIKIERAQGEVDQRRSLSQLADMVEGEAFDHEAARKVTDGRVESERRVQEAVVTLLAGLHELLDEEQREALAYMIRSGELSL